MKHDQGFTLTETLVALLVISLSLAALIVAASLVARFDRRGWTATKQEREIATTESRIAAILHAREPLRGDDLVGTARRFDYVCTPGAGNAPDCHFTLSESDIPNVHMMYASENEIRPDWPPQTTTGETEPPRLEALILQDGQNKTLAVIRLGTDQDKDCQFDMISRTCREDSQGATSGVTP